MPHVTKFLFPKKLRSTPTPWLTGLFVLGKFVVGKIALSKLRGISSYIYIYIYFFLNHVKEGLSIS